MIELRDIRNQRHMAEVRDQRVFIDDAEVWDLQPAPAGDGIYLILRGRVWPLHVTADQLQPLTPIALHLPRTYACFGCQQPVVHLHGPPPDETWCQACAAAEATHSSAWEAQRAAERQQYARMDRAQLETLYQQAKAQLRTLPHDSPDWHHWRRVQLDTARVLSHG